MATKTELQMATNNLSVGQKLVGQGYCQHGASQAHPPHCSLNTHQSCRHHIRLRLLLIKQCLYVKELHYYQL